MKIVSISLSIDDVKALKDLSKRARVSRSQVMREALRQYKLDQQWQRIRAWGRETALKFNITSYDDVERIAGRHA